MAGTVCTGLLSSKWHKDLTREIDQILARELEKISAAMDETKSENDFNLLSYHFDRLRYMQVINDGKYTSNDPTMKEQTILTLID